MFEENHVEKLEESVELEKPVEKLEEPVEPVEKQLEDKILPISTKEVRKNRGCSKCRSNIRNIKRYFK